MAPTIAERFPTAATSQPPTDQQKAIVAVLQAKVISLAEHIEGMVPDGRDKSIALTSLEDVLMRVNRGVFTGGR